MEIKPIAYIHTDFCEKFGIPRQSGRVPDLIGEVAFTPEFNNPEAIRGLEEFSHIWLIFGFSEAQYKEGTMTVRPPRLGGNARVGVFASRSPYRPNSLGLSCVKLEKIEQGKIIVSGVDILDKTPIYDIKPYIPYSDSIPGALGSFAEEMKDHCLEVDFPHELLQIISEEKQEAVISCLRDDPRPTYQVDGRSYSMAFAEYDIHFTVENKKLTVTSIDKKSNG
jgi:tRNA-Thr(GGU) m(6)t(6)A37 methyltransferase TsaA